MKNQMKNQMRCRAASFRCGLQPPESVADGLAGRFFLLTSATGLSYSSKPFISLIIGRYPEEAEDLLESVVNMFRIRFLLAVFLVPVLFAPANAGEPALVKALPDDEKGVVIRGRVGADDSFVKRIGLFSSTNIPEVIFRSTDLTGSGGTALIGRHQVVPASTTKFFLSKNTPKDFEIKVTGVKSAGVYEGKLLFLQPDRGVNPDVTLPIKVIAETVPKLTQRKGSESVKIQLLKCGWWCGPRWLQPNALIGTYTLQFDNANLKEFSASTSVAAIGDHTRTSLGTKLQVQTTQVDTKPVFELPIDVKPGEELYPDHYVGDIKLVLPWPDAALRIPLEVNVRHGPILPIIFLVLGIGLGRIAKYMKEKGGPQSDLLLQAYQLESKMQSSADQPILQPMLEDAKSMIYDMKLDQAKTELAAIENRWLLLNTLRSLEQTLQPRAGDAPVARILANIQAARTLTETKQDQQAAALVLQIETDIRNLGAAPAPAARLATAQARKANVLAARTATGAGYSPPSRWARMLVRLTGISGPLRAETTLWIIRPLVYILLIVALLIVGLQQLYLKNAIFGVDPLSDYFGLLVWAMSSDVASRTLSSLKTAAG
jgi:hypothetical protein